jgi:hypothetical protein
MKILRSAKFERQCPHYNMFLWLYSAPTIQLFTSQICLQQLYSLYPFAAPIIAGIVAAESNNAAERSKSSSATAPITAGTVWPSSASSRRAAAPTI